MNWDERGRLWVCVTIDYPNELRPRGEGRDRIVMLEDTDRDGRADKNTLFAEGLSIPTAILCVRGGVIVQDGTETLFLKDTDGDDKADVREVLMTGWRMNDTHGGVSNFRYGLDNWIWAMQGYNDSSPVLHGRNGEQKETQRFRQGFFRFKLDDGDPPVVTDLEFLRSTDNNTWGLGISEEGLIFGSTANRNPSVFMPVPNRYYEQVRGWTPQLTLRMISDTYLFKPVVEEAKVRQVDQHGGYTAGAGHALYTARRYPESWWNRTAFVCGPTGKLIGTFVLEPDGAGFKSSNRFNLVASYDEWAAPIMAEVGPDGNVWFIDWYNYIVQHNPTPRGFETGQGNAYETDLRDKRHGRVYRMEYGTDDAPWPNLAGEAPSSDLVAALTHPVMLWRLQAQRLLVDRKDLSVVPQLIKLVQDQTIDAIGLNVGAIHALWTLAGIGALDGSSADAVAAVETALTHPSAGVRRNAVQVLGASSPRVASIVDKGLLTDADPQVRLAAFLALADAQASDDAGRAIAAAFSNPANRDDRWIADAATSAAARHAASFLANVVSADAPSPELLERTRIVAEHFARGGGEDVATIVARLDDANPEAAAVVIEGLFAGWPENAPPKLPEDASGRLVGLLERLPSGSQPALVQLGDRWQVAGFEQYIEEIAGKLLAQLDDAAQSDADRAEAAARLVSFQSQSEEAIDSVLSRITPQSSPALARGLVEALEHSSAPALADRIVAQLPMLSPDVKEASLRLLLSREATVAELLDAIEGGKVHVSELTLDMQQALLGHRDRRIAYRSRGLLRESGGLPSPDRQAVIEELISVTQTTGDVARGLEVFKKNCSQCHVHGELGERIGPDLTGMAVHPKSELLEQVLDPSRSVEGNFRMYIIQAGGRTLQGLVAGESRTAIELIDTEGKRHSILREDIDEGGLVASTKSIMPEGFEKQMTPAELADLLEFLTQRGQYVPVDIRKAATIASDRGMFTDVNDRGGRLIFPEWGPKEFKGVPFRLIDPNGGRVPNAIMLRSERGDVARRMPMDVEVPINMPAKSIHMLGGVSGWGYPYGRGETTAMILRLYYADGDSEEHELKNGVHFADYNGQSDVPGSERAFNLRGRQVRYLKIEPQRDAPIERMQLIKGREDTSAPIVMAMTIETR
jgi:putative membrane-bound dehydrogenase-like protein